MELELPELQVRLHQDSARLPADISIQFPRDLALSLLRRRMATPVGDITNAPDLIVDEADLEHVAFDIWPEVIAE